MAGLFITPAVAAVKAAFVAGFQTQLTAVETAHSLDEGALEPPEAYVSAFLPHDERRIMEFYEDGGATPSLAGQRNRIWHVPVTVIFSFKHDADAEDGEEKAYQYLDAMLRVIEADTTLSGAVVQTAIERAGTVRARNESETRKHVGLFLDVLWA